MELGSVIFVVSWSFGLRPNKWGEEMEIWRSAERPFLRLRGKKKTSFGAENHCCSQLVPKPQPHHHRFYKHKPVLCGGEHCLGPSQLLAPSLSHPTALECAPEIHSGESTVTPCRDVTPLWALCVGPGAERHHGFGESHPGMGWRWKSESRSVRSNDFIVCPPNTLQKNGLKSCSSCKNADFPHPRFSKTKWNTLL